MELTISRPRETVGELHAGSRGADRFSPTRRGRVIFGNR